ncbi:MAG: lysophospholipid acyltransferase family protein [Anaerolineae bacterium]
MNSTSEPARTVAFRYPRRVIVRSVLRVLGRIAMRFLTRPTVTGAENFPQSGPVILVGNHVAMLEAVMMVLYAPYLVELIGTGEIPLDPRYSWAVDWFGYIPIRRGAMDREALTAALDVLKQGGVVGIFPEGGIWESAAKKGKSGVAWLSYQSGAPVVPIGFGGIDGALKAAFNLKRPAVTMNVGHTIAAINGETDGKARKTALEEAAAYIMGQVDGLIPEADKKRWRRVYDERFELQLVVQNHGGEVVGIPPELTVKRPDMLAKFFHRPLMLDVFVRNLKLPVQALQTLDTEHDSQKLAQAADVILNYLKTNPHFLTYRFGYDEGGAMEAGLRELRDIGYWAEKEDLKMIITPIRRFRQRGQEGEFVEMNPGSIPLL